MITKETMPTYKLTLCDDQGELLSLWPVSIENSEDAETWNVAKGGIVSQMLCTAIEDEIRRHENKRMSER